MIKLNGGGRGTDGGYCPHWKSEDPPWHSHFAYHCKVSLSSQRFFLVVSFLFSNFTRLLCFNDITSKHIKIKRQ